MLIACVYNLMLTARGKSQHSSLDNDKTSNVRSASGLGCDITLEVMLSYCYMLVVVAYKRLECLAK